MSHTIAINYERPLTVSNARKTLGELIRASFVSPKPVRIRLGDMIVRLTPEVMPEPIEVLPPGAIVIDDERAAMLNSFPEGPITPDFTT